MRTVALFGKYGTRVIVQQIVGNGIGALLNKIYELIGEEIEINKNEILKLQ